MFVSHGQPEQGWYYNLQEALGVWMWGWGQEMVKPEGVPSLMGSVKSGLALRVVSNMSLPGVAFEDKVSFHSLYPP